MKISLSLPKSWLPITLVALCLPAVLPARGQSTTLADAKGDASSPVAYLDLLEAGIRYDSARGEFTFTMTLAEPIPAAPSQSFISWQWPLDTDPAQAPGGNQFEYLVTVRWSDGIFEGFLVDRLQNIQTALPFEIAGNQLTVTVDAASLGRPTEFQWRPHTKLCPGACTTLTDRVPDKDLARWPEPPPGLNIQKAIILSWPASPQEWTVESAPTASGPWTKAGVVPTTANQLNTLALPMNIPTLYYRLTKP